MKTSSLIGFPNYESCTNLSEVFSNDTNLICLQFTIPTLDNFFTTVGVSYGFTIIIFKIIQFIMTLNVGPKASKIVCIVSISIIIGIMIVMIFLIAFVSTFTSWLTNSFINYLIPFMIIIAILISIIIFGCMNNKLASLSDPFQDGDFVYFIRKKD